MPTLLLLCGEVEYPLEQFDYVVTWCPVRHELLKQKGISNYLFGNFSPGAERGRKMDIEYNERVDESLHQEAKTNPKLTWAPLIIQQIKWRLFRYVWLKQCACAIIEQFHPETVIVSSNEDTDIVNALIAVGRSFNIQVEVRSGLQDTSAATIYLSAPYGIPPRLDPLVFSFAYWCILKVLQWPSKKKMYLESYPNLRGHNFPHGVYLFDFFKSLSFFWLALNKITTILHIHMREVLVDSRLSVSNAAPFILQKESWKFFSEDEQVLINGLVCRFFCHYPHKFLDAVARRLSLFFLITKPNRIVLMVDQLDRDRLAANIAKKHNIQVDYLPHGIAYEDYSGRNNFSAFQPDCILAWNEESKRAFMESGWQARTIRHPAHQQSILPIKPLPSDRALWRVLVLIPDWEAVSLENREDCTAVGLMAIYRALTSVGVLGKNIGVKSHFTPITTLLDQQGSVIKALQQSLGMEFQILDATRKTQQLFAEYDLVILGATTGVFEAARFGIPLVFFGPGFDRVGALRGYALPQAKSKEELEKTLGLYDCESVGQVYARLVASFQSGESIALI